MEVSVLIQVSVLKLALLGQGLLQWLKAIAVSTIIDGGWPGAYWCWLMAFVGTDGYYPSVPA